MGNMPLYKSVMQKLESQIANGDWKPGDRLPTETELEQIFAVSNITIRHALKELVAKGLVRRVRGGGSYVNPFPGTVTGEDGRNVAGHIIGLLLPNNRSNGDMMDIVCGVSNICIRCGYLLNVTNYGINGISEAGALEQLAQKSTGVLYYPMDQRSSFECMYMLGRRHFPLVTLDQTANELELPSVVSDNQDGAYEATRYLLRKGHKEICFVGTTGGATTIKERFIGFCRAMEEGGYQVESRHYSTIGDTGGKTTDEEHDQIIRRLIQRPRPVTAVLAVNDYVAYELMKAAERCHVEVPTELSIVGFDNLPFIEQMRLPLTTVSQDLYTIGERAAMLLIDRLEGRAALSVTVPVKLVKRASVCALGSGEAEARDKGFDAS